MSLAAASLSAFFWILAPALRGAASIEGAQLPVDAGWLLELPYVPQTKALCGGAAAAMVLRYWGEDGVYAEDFAGFVNPKEQAIPTEALTRAIQERGWWARAFRGSEELVKSQLAQGRPLVVLLEDSPGQYHYISLIGWLPGRVVLHDPGLPTACSRSASFVPPGQARASGRS